MMLLLVAVSGCKKYEEDSQSATGTSAERKYHAFDTYHAVNLVSDVENTRPHLLIQTW
jgi:hypothetical protein